MANYHLFNDSIDIIPINGAKEGDVFMAASGDVAAIEATIVSGAASAPALRLRPLVSEAAGVSVDVTDSASATLIHLLVDIGEEPRPRGDLALDFASVTHEPLDTGVVSWSDKNGKPQSGTQAEFDRHKAANNVTGEAAPALPPANPTPDPREQARVSPALPDDDVQKRQDAARPRPPVQS